MLLGQKHRRRLGGGVVAVLVIGLAVGSGPALAAAAPTLGETWVSSVFSSTAHLQAEINPNGVNTTYHIDYIPDSAYEANLAAGREPFSGAKRTPASVDANVGAGSGAVTVTQQLSSLAAETAYRYRFVAHSSAGTVESEPPLKFVTEGLGGAPLPDSRGYELVSPVDKNGGQVDAPGALAGGGVLQAAAGGQSFTYGSSASFGEGAQGAPPASQYLGSRTAGGWSTQNVTAPLYSASYNTAGEGVPYQLFSADLARALLLNGRRCRGEGSGCAVPNPPLAGTGAPEGYQNYYLREGSGYTALLGDANAGFLGLEPSDFELRFAGATPGLGHVVLSTCAALTANATEAPLGEGCDPGQANLYEFSPGAGLSLVNVLPGDSQGSPGAALGAQSLAISADGSRVYFTQGGDLYLREDATTKQVDESQGGGGVFQTASADGSLAFFTDGPSGDEALYRYDATSGTSEQAAGEVVGVLGASEDGSLLYYATASGLFLWDGGAATEIAPGAGVADAGDYPPTTGTARVSADGAQLLFVSSAPLTEYDNRDLNTGNLDSEVFLYDATARSLACVSCNPTFERPVGPSTISGAVANGTAPTSTDSYKPRVLSADGRRAFFDSEDAIGLADTNQAPDVYQWEAQGEGSCARAGGCVSLLSGGKATGGASFADASADGSDAFFLTAGSLVPSDPGAVDLYDARVGGGFPTPPPPLACEGDACQPLPSEPIDPTLTTLLPGLGNPAVRFPGGAKHCKKGFRKHRGRCVKVKAKKRHAQQGKSKSKKAHRKRGRR